jgi:hypothetical protein
MPDRSVQVVVDPDGEDGAGHNRLHRLIAAGEPPYHVLPGDNAQNATVFADDNRRRGTRPGHAADDFSRGQVVPHHERRRRHVVANHVTEYCSLRRRHAPGVPALS